MGYTLNILLKKKKWLFVLVVLLFAVHAFGVSNGVHSIESESLRVTVGSKGEIISIFDKKNKKTIPFSGNHHFEDCIVSVQSIIVENELITIQKKVTINEEKSCSVTETLGFEENLLKWELEILPAGDMPWSTNVKTVWSLAGPDVNYWTTWGDPRPEATENNLSKTAMDKLLNGEVVTASANLPNLDWADPLVPQPLFPRKLYYGASIYGNPETNTIFDGNIWFYPGSRRNYFSVPIVGLFDEKKKIWCVIGLFP